MSNDGQTQGYPSYRSVDVGLRDGSTVRIRPVVPADVDQVIRMFERLSDQSRRMRFHGGFKPTESNLRPFVEVDYHDSFGLVAETASKGGADIVALASYVKTDRQKAEIAIAVDDRIHGRGIGSIMIEHLSEAATEAGIQTFEAEVLSSNAEMFDVFRSLKLPIETRTAMGVVHMEMPTSPTPEALEAFDEREAVSAAAGVEGFLLPRSVAVIGASRKRGSIGGEVFHNLLDGDFNGPVYPVNPKAEVVQSVAAYKSVIDTPGDVDMAVIVVPAAYVLDAARECASKGVRALLVISAGFSEIGPEGKQRQAELLSIARRHGMRIVGPNCMGLMNTDDRVRLNATFAPNVPPPGRLAFSSQSGALGIAVIDKARELGLGLSSFVSVGNKADISGNDLLQFWERDGKTDVILLYLESFGNPRKFARIARRTSRKKPIVAVKSGRSAAGARAAASHTGSIVAGDIAVDALFKQAGVIRTNTLEELFDAASLLGNQPLPQGRRVGILTNAGGLGILCADACETAGLEIPELGRRTTEGLRSLLPEEASVGNPVDMIASASAEQYARSLRLMLEDETLHSVIVIFIPPLVTRAEDVATAIMEVAAERRDKTILSCFLGVHGVYEQLRRGATVVPSFSFPESAARALGQVASYAEWRNGPLGQVREFDDCDRSNALRLVARKLESGDGWLDPASVSELLGCYGIASARSRQVDSADDVRSAAEEIRKPVAVKVVSQSIVHKTDIGGVRLGLETPDDAEAAAKEIEKSLTELGMADELDGFLVQEMVTLEGAEMFVGVTQDPLFGPLLACGAGGTMVELIRDVSVRITPLTDLDAREMITSLKTYPRFEGYRGQPPLDRGAFEELLLRLSTMVEHLPAIADLDFNPVLVAEKGAGCMVLDARIKVASPAPERPRGARTVTGSSPHQNRKA